jgi:hypothetical protein
MPTRDQARLNRFYETEFATRIPDGFEVHAIDPRLVPADAGESFIAAHGSPGTPVTKHRANFILQRVGD